MGVGSSAALSCGSNQPIEWNSKPSNDGEAGFLPGIEQNVVVGRADHGRNPHTTNPSTCSGFTVHDRKKLSADTLRVRASRSKVPIRRQGDSQVRQIEDSPGGDLYGGNHQLGDSVPTRACGNFEDGQRLQLGGVQDLASLVVEAPAKNRPSGP